MRIGNRVLGVYRAVHSWTGLVCGLLLFVAFLAGAVTMFAEPLARWAEPPHPELALADVPAALDRILATRPEARDELTLYVGPSEAEPRFFWRDPDSGDAFVAGRGADGGLTIGPLRSARLARAVDLIHRAGGLPIDRDLALDAMGVVSILYFVAIISGLIVVLRSIARDLFALRTGRSLKLMWRDAHNVIGVVSLPFHLFIALTAIGFAFDGRILDAQDDYIYQGRLDEIAAIGTPYDEVKPVGGAAAMLPPETLIDRVRTVAPGFAAETIRYFQPGQHGAVAIVGGRDPADLTARTANVRLDAATGRILNDSELPGRGSGWNATAAGFSALHFGTFGGVIVRWAYLLLGLGGAFLFHSGNMLWIESRRRKAKGAGDRLARVMASAAIGIAFGSIAGLSLTIASAKWVPADIADLEAWHGTVFHVVLLAALLTSLVVGAARSVVPLTLFAAAAAATIPLTSLAGALVPALGIWNNPGAPLGIDIAAAAAALALAQAARVTARRIAAAPADSVWYRRRGAGEPAQGLPAGRSAARIVASSQPPPSAL